MEDPSFRRVGLVQAILPRLKLQLQITLQSLAGLPAITVGTCPVSSPERDFLDIFPYPSFQAPETPNTSAPQKLAQLELGRPGMERAGGWW